MNAQWRMLTSLWARFVPQERIRNAQWRRLPVVVSWLVSYFRGSSCEHLLGDIAAVLGLSLSKCLEMLQDFREV